MKEHSGKIRNPILRPGAICTGCTAEDPREVRK